MRQAEFLPDQTFRELVIEAQGENMLRTIQVSQFGVFHTCQMAAQQMARQSPVHCDEGKIVIISSILEELAPPANAAYNMARAAINHFGRTLAAEMARYHINVNMISPGWIDMPGERTFASEEDIQQGGKQIPWGRPGTLEDIGRAVTLLCSAEAD